MDYYYPDNMASQALIANLWNGRDMAIITGLFVFCILTVIVFSSFIPFILLFAYAIASAKFANGYSITKIAVLYIRFLITDVLIYHWR